MEAYIDVEEEHNNSNNKKTLENLCLIYLI